MTAKIPDLVSKLRDIEEALHERESHLAACCHARELIAGAAVPLEIVSNLTYLIRHSAHDPAMVASYTSQMQREIAALARIHADVLHRFAETAPHDLHDAQTAAPSSVH